MDVDADAERVPAETYRPVVAAVQSAFRAAAPSLRRTSRDGVEAFHGTGPIATLSVAADHVSVGFHHGGELARRHSLLEGKGRGVRHVKLRTVAEARSPAFRALVKDAVELDRIGPRGSG